MTNKKIIYICGFIKSGNTWLSRLIGDALNSPINGGNAPALADEGHDRPGEYVIRQAHLLDPPESGQVVYIYRDPRDVAVSILHYWERGNLDNVLVHEWSTPPKILHGGGGWAATMCRWVHHYSADAVTNYEALHKNTIAELDRILVALGVDTLSLHLDAVVGRQSFDVRKKEFAGARYNDASISYGKDIQLKNMRKGIVGDWQNEFKRRHGKLAQLHWGYWLETLGYEGNTDWWKELPE